VFKKNDKFLDESILARLVLYGMTPFLPIRFIYGWGIAFNGAFWTSLIPYLGGSTPDKFNWLQKTFLLYLVDFTAKNVLLTLSVVWTFKSRPKVCYKKYLGPDWTPYYDKAGCIVTNHSSFADILVQM